MAGRGRGKFGKPSMSFSSEQLGFAKGEVLPPPVLEPPPKYPTLEYEALTFTITNEMSYLLELKRDYTEYLRESSYYVQPIELKKDIERYSDRYQDMMTDKSGYETKYDWSKIPAELKPAIRRQKSQSTAQPKKKQKTVDIESKLQELEKKENTMQSDVQEEEGKAEEETEEKEMDEVVEDEEEELDEEMDEGTDYVNNYFDNGEGYDDEEDNMDDGPIY
ncbi:hypothetical protein KPH14_004863 [Odynerus spinipes]|uniref:DNA-directed RNA polymerase III subunit n=1 Tax=Odynerus spinipes TaxID=1348599 RepID=A0AAD9VQ36_9HYME|nr:hypothetical protein KPH14_004863 [Odynerus spinipes]